jgi:hypothetical protein
MSRAADFEAWQIFAQIQKKIGYGEKEVGEEGNWVKKTCLCLERHCS